jgi:hypothetical protein
MKIDTHSRFGLAYGSHYAAAYRFATTPKKAAPWSCCAQSRPNGRRFTLSWTAQGNTTTARFSTSESKSKTKIPAHCAGARTCRRNYPGN